MRERLPKGWIEIQLEEILFSLESGSRPKGGVKGILDGIPSIGGEHLNDKGGFNFTNIRYIPIDYYNRLNKGHIGKNDILIVKDGATTGKTSYVENSFPFKKAVVNEHVFVLKMKANIISKCFFFFLWSYEGNKRILANFQGSAQGGINRQFITNTLVSLPPLNEQKRIVAKLDAIIPRIDSLKARLDKIPALIKRFRQSVLTAAVIGKLTEKWREKHPEVETAEVLLRKIRKEHLDLYKQKKSNKPKATAAISQDEEKYDIDNNWKWCRLSDVALKMSTGPFGSTLHKSDYVENGIPVINPTNIINDRLIPSEKMMISQTTSKRLLKYSLLENDIVIARRGDLSKCGIVTKNEDGWLCGTGSFFLKLGINPIFFRLFYISDFCQAELNDGAIGTTMANLNQKVLANVPFPLPPLEEQKEIVRQVDNLFTLADKLEAHFQNAKTCIDKLSQSVLAKAFRGELVPQDPDDEPAEKLLERIMAEKTKMEEALKGSKKKGGRKKVKAGSRK